MNKTILLATFVLLLAVQGYNAQFLSGLFSLVAYITGFVFNLVIVIPTVIISFANVFVVTVSNVVFATLLNVNRGVHDSLANINSTVNNIGNLSNYYRSLISNETSGSTFLGQVIIGNLRDSINAVGYTSAALSAVVVGCLPPQPPPKSFLDDHYPFLDFRLSNSTTNCSNTPIQVQASNFVSLSRFHTRNMNLAFAYIQQIAQDLYGSPVGPDPNNTQSLLDLWANVSAEASLYFTVNANGTFLSFANASFSGSFSAAINGTGKFLNDLINGTDTLVKSSKIRRFRGSKIRNAGNWHRVFNARGRRMSFINSLIGFNSFRANVLNSLSAILGSANQFSISINGISTSSFIFTTARNHGNAFGNLINKLNNGLNAFLNFVNETVNNVEQDKTDIALNATSAINASITELIDRILSENNTECLNITNSLTELFANFSLGLQDCGQNADNKTQIAQAAAADIYRILFSNVSALMNATNACYSNGCAGNIWFPFSSNGVQCANDNSFNGVCTRFIGFIPVLYSCPSPKANTLISCLSNLITTANSQANSTDSSVNGTTSALSTAINGILSNMRTCVESNVNSTLNALESITTDYENCANSTALAGEAE